MSIGTRQALGRAVPDETPPPTGAPPFAGGATSGAGQTLVEFALVLPVLALIFGAVIQLAFIYETQMGLTNATREAARRAAAFPTDDANRDANAAWILDQLADLLPSHVQAYDPAESTVELCYDSTVDPAGDAQLHAQVSVTYRHVLFIPLVAGILDGLDGASDGRIEVGATSDIRIRNSPGLADAACYS